MKIGNIVSTTKINISEVFNVVKSLDDIIQGLPTLIVGWSQIKNKYPKYDILNRCLSEDLFWTFKINENRILHESDITTFTSFCYQKIIKNVKYIFVDPLHYSKKKLYKIIRKIYFSEKTISYFYEKMLYLNVDDLIFGIDLRLLEYMGYDIEKFSLKIKSISKIFLVDDEILIGYKKHIEHLDNSVRYMPYLYSLTNG